MAKTPKTPARNGAPSNGKYAKKTKPSAKNGIQTYFQNGLDFKPKSMQEGGYSLLEPVEKAERQAPYIRRDLVGFTDKAPAPAPKKAYSKLEEIYTPKYEQYLDAIEKPHGYSYQGDAALKLKTGKFNRASVPKKLIEEAYNAAQQEGIDPYLLYGMIGQESTFGGALDSIGKVKSKRNLVSGWNLAEQYNPTHPLRFLADKKVPGVKATKTFHGYEFDITDEEAMEQYLTKNPKLRQQYIRTIQSKEVPKDYDQFRQAAKFIREKGFEKYNPGDKTYKDSVMNSMNLLKKDPVFSSYVQDIERRNLTEKPSNTKIERDFQLGGPIEDNMGQWAHPGKVTKINSNKITMKGVPYPVLGVSDTGDTKMMKPGKNYAFDGTSVTEYPNIQNKGQLKKLDQLTRMAKSGAKVKKAQNGYREPTIEDYYGEGMGMSNPAGSGKTPIDMAGSLEKIGGIGGALDIGSNLIQGVQMLGQEKKNRKQAKKFAAISGLVKQAATSRPDEPTRKYVRPEDMVFDPNQMSPSYGTGTNFLQLKKGGEIQNTYAPKTLYDGLEELPRAQFGMQAGSLGSWAGSKLFGGTGQQSGAGQIGSTIGSTVGNFIPIPGTGAVLGAVGGLIGGAFGAKGQKETAKYQKEAQGNLAEAAYAQGMQGRFSSFMEHGGNTNPQIIDTFGKYKLAELLKADPTMNTLRSGGHLKEDYVAPNESAFEQYAMGGDLKTHWGGKAQPTSYNPYLPDGGESVEFKGQSHEDGGIGITFGKSPVEVEGGEPAVKLKSGGNTDSLVVFGDMKIPSYGVSEIGDPKAKGKKFKTYVKDLNEQENKQNKVVEKGTSFVNDANEADPFERLKMNSGEAMMIGGNMKLKNIAQKKQMASIVQNAILESAEENGLEPASLAEGKIKKGKVAKNAQFGNIFDKDSEFLQLVREIQTMPGKKEKRSVVGQEEATADLIKKLPGVLGNGQLPKKQYPFPITSVTKAPINSYELEGYKPVVDTNARNQVRPDQFTGEGNFGQYWYTDQGEGNGQPVYKKETAAPKKDNKIPSKTNPIDTTFKKHISPINTPSMGRIGSPELNSLKDLSDSQRMPTETVSKTSGKKDKSGLGVEDFLNAYLPYLRPSNQKDLDPNQLMGEMFALSTNNLEPVQAQRYNPLLETPTKLSYQDALNENQADFNAIQRQVGNNPAALAALAGQKYGANAKVIAEQERQNQDRLMGAFNRNRGVLNDATLKNLAIMDTQYQRQATAKSNTKAVAQAALSSISDKIAKNKLENKTLGIYENLYNYRFGPQGRAWNLNAPAQFNTEGNYTPVDEQGNVVESERTIDRDGLYNIKRIRDKVKSKKSTNGSIVKSLK